MSFVGENSGWREGGGDSLKRNVSSDLETSGQVSDLHCRAMNM
jgi:hypothetical protein